MAYARKCDRCGAFYTPEMVTNKTVVNAVAGISMTDKPGDNNYSVLKTYELCPNCTNKVLILLKEKSGDETTK